MKIKLWMLLFFISLHFPAYTAKEHSWKEFGYAGLGAGTYNFNDSQDDYFVSGMAFYHSQLFHHHPKAWSTHVDDWGILGSASWFMGDRDTLFVTGQFSKGLWLDKTALLQISFGPSWSDRNSWGASSTLYLSYQWSLMDNTLNAGVIFIQNDIYNDQRLDFGVGYRFSLGISIGVGALNQAR